MASKLVINYKEREIVLDYDQNKTVREIKEQLQNNTKIPLIQQELSYKQGDQKIVLTDNEKNLKFIKIPPTGLYLKNLGRQIRWEHVFYIEYLGPIIIMPLFYVFGKKQLYTPVQNVALAMGILHYLKRQYETAFVHVFSRQSMPFKRVLINSFHYWILFALLNSIQLYLYPSGHTYSTPVIGVLVGLWAIFEFLNFKCHKILGDFRKPETKVKNDKEYENAAKKRQIPYGWGFNSISCANYFWQALGWLMFSVLTRNWTAYIFTIFSIVQMAKWAVEKHRRYKRQFKDNYPKGRKAMIPFLL